MPELAEEPHEEVVDLMAALRESVEQTQRQKRKQPTRKRAKKAS